MQPTSDRACRQREQYNERVVNKDGRSSVVEPRNACVSLKRWAMHSGVVSVTSLVHVDENYFLEILIKKALFTLFYLSQMGFFTCGVQMISLCLH